MTGKWAMPHHHWKLHHTIEDMHYVGFLGWLNPLRGEQKLRGNTQSLNREILNSVIQGQLILRLSPLRGSSKENNQDDDKLL